MHFTVYVFNDYTGIRDDYKEKYIEYLNEKNIAEMNGLDNSFVTVHFYGSAALYDFHNDPVQFLQNLKSEYSIQIYSEVNELEMLSSLKI